MDVPEHEDLVRDLLTLRERGLIRLRSADLRHLRRAAALRHPATDPVAAVEKTLRDAVGRLGEGTLGSGAAYTFGLVQGTRDWPAAARRKRAADVYRLSVERFRKNQERVLLGQVADQIIALCGEGGEAALPRVALGARIPIETDGGRAILQVRPIELISGVDVLVNPENVYLEMARVFSPSVSGAIRKAGSRRGPAGELLDDTVQRELHEWMAKHHRPGLTVAPGTVVPTGPGSLAFNGVRRIYHAAVSVPRPGTDDQDVTPSTIMLAVHRVFALAEEERVAYRLKTICFPLIGTGHGRMAVRAGLHWLWSAISENLARSRGWEVHLSVPEPEKADMVLRQLSP
ncbi:macro domain-containing protein [Herbidospora sp. RD11066]